MLPLLDVVVLLVLLVVLLVLLDLGDKKVPTVVLRNASYSFNLTKATTDSALLRRLEVEEEVFPPDNTAAWNQAPSTMHISGPPESP